MVTKAISPVPTGATVLQVWESTEYSGLYALLVELPVTTGQASISFEATLGRFYKLRHWYPEQGAFSAYSPIWYYVASTTTCVVSGRCLGPHGQPVSGVTARATLNPINMVDANGDLVQGTVSTTSDANGDWGLALVRNAKLENPNARYTISLSGQGYSKTKSVIIPDQETAEFSDLVFGGSLAVDLTLTFQLHQDSKKWLIGDKKYLTIVVEEADGKIDDLTGCTARIRIFNPDGTEKLAWGAATLDGMAAKRLVDSAGWTAGTYQAQAEITDAAAVEKVQSKRFGFTVAAS